MTHDIFCIHCEKPVGELDDRCPHCGEVRVAPPCPRCGKPVTTFRGKRFYEGGSNGYYPWHYGWDGRCVACGHEIAANLRIRTGHSVAFSDFREEALKMADTEELRADPFAGISDIAICGGESSTMNFDAWDHQPTIEVTITRAVAGNIGDPRRHLPHVAHIAMTPGEWETVIAQLTGPLSVLMQRKPWFEDTT